MAFANDLVDPKALNAVWGPENQRKADDGPDRWSPPEASYRCAYVAAYQRIKARWDLSVTPAQAAAIAATSAGCAGPAASVP